MHQLPAPAAWALDPAVILVLVALLASYALVIGPLRPRYQAQPVEWRRIVYFGLGWVTLALSVISPLDTLGRYYLFVAHCTQLFIIITASTPLMMMGLPDTLARRLLPTRSLREVGRDPLFAMVAVALFNILVLVWHAGPLYEAAVQNTPLHDLQLLTFVVAGFLTWWPLLTPADERVRMSSPIQILYLAAESIPLDVFGIFTIFAGGILYHNYAVAPRVFGLSAVADQQLGGGVLAVPGNILDLILMSVVFFGWIRQIEAAQIARERLLYDDEDVEDTNGETDHPTGGVSGAAVE